MNEQPKINRGWSDFTPTIDCDMAARIKMFSEQARSYSKVCINL